MSEGHNFPHLPLLHFDAEVTVALPARTEKMQCRGVRRHGGGVPRKCRPITNTTEKQHAVRRSVDERKGAVEILKNEQTLKDQTARKRQR